MVYLFIIISYLVGSIPTGLVLARLTGAEDIRKAGSGNIGATNVTRLLGKKLGAFTLLGDILKAVVPMLAAHIYYVKSGTSFSPKELDMAVSLCGGAAFLGHLFPIYLNFRGGKGVATALGVFIVLDPLAVLISLFLFIAVVILIIFGLITFQNPDVTVTMKFIKWNFEQKPIALMLAESSFQISNRFFFITHCRVGTA